MVAVAGILLFVADLFADASWMQVPIGRFSVPTAVLVLAPSAVVSIVADMLAPAPEGEYW